MNDLDLPQEEVMGLKANFVSEKDKIAIYFIQNLLSIERGGKKANFRIGDGFISSWNINGDREKPMPKKELVKDGIWLAIKSFILKLFGYFKKENDGHGSHENKHDHKGHDH